MRYRRLDADGDMVAGQGRNDFATGREAVAQAVKTRLWLLYGEWWEDQTDGLPLWQQILGVAGVTKEQLDRIYQTRIAATPEVTAITELASSLVSRSYSMTCKAATPYGAVAVSLGGQ